MPACLLVIQALVTSHTYLIDGDAALACIVLLSAGHESL